MAKTIANFLVGIGLDTKDFDKGSKSVDTSLSGFRSKAQLAGGAIAAAFGAASVAAINAGNRSDEFIRKVAKFDTSSRFIYNLGNAFRLMGGNAEDAITTISKAEGILDALRKGDASALESAGLAQVDVSRLQTSRDGEELLKNLSDILSSPNTKDWQKRSLQETFGLSNEGLVLLSKGRAEIDAVVNGVDKYAEGLEKAAEAGRAYSEALSKVGIQFDHIGNVLADKLLPKFTEIINGVSGFIDKNMPRIGAAADYIADNAGAVTAIGGGLAAGATAGAASSVAAKLGMKGLARIGAGASYGGYAGAAIGAGSLLYDLKSSDIKDVTGYDVSKYYRSPSETVEAIGNWWRVGSVSPDDAASSTPSAEAARRPNLSEIARQSDSVPQVIQIDSKMYLDGREIGNFVERHQVQKNYDAYIESQRTEAR